MSWRVGTKLGRTLYRDEVFVGCMDTPELAAEVVAAMNESSPLRQERDALIVKLGDEYQMTERLTKDLEREREFKDAAVRAVTRLSDDLAVAREALRTIERRFRRWQEGDGTTVYRCLEDIVDLERAALADPDICPCKDANCSKAHVRNARLSPEPGDKEGQ